MELVKADLLVKSIGRDYANTVLAWINTELDEQKTYMAGCDASEASYEQAKCKMLIKLRTNLASVINGK